jgi:hypothetical protein
MVYKQIILPLISDQQFHKLNFKWELAFLNTKEQEMISSWLMTEKKYFL